MEHYLAVRDGRAEPYFHVARRMACDFDPDASMDELWRVHEQCSRRFWRAYPDVEKGSPTFLDLKVLLAERMFSSCTFCERRCKVDRRHATGFCGVRESRVASYFLHWGEEDPLIPSGTIFFAGCTFRCAYCQNWDISFFPEVGEPVDGKKLARMMEELEGKGARNVNLVGGEPTPHLLVVLRALRETSARLPIIWNSNLYLTPETLRLLLEVVDLWLPDFKYWDNRCAQRLSLVPRYREVITRNLLALRGRDVIVRHLVLPGHVECCTKKILRWITEHLPNVYVNVMFQYRPDWKVLEDPAYADMRRTLTEDEMQEALSAARAYGIKMV